MRRTSVLLLVLGLTSPAAAQSVTVNPMGTQVLIDPGTGQQRVVEPLLQPWEQTGTIQLRPPRKHRTRPAPSEAAASPVESTPAPAVAEAPPPRVERPKPARRVAATPPPAPAPQAGPDPTDDLFARAQRNTLQPSQQPAPRAAAPKPPQRTAAIERPSAKPVTGKRRDVITFAAGATDPSTSAVSAVRALAGSLNSALADSGSRVQLLAYGGARGEKSSDTRRLSLKRALVVRQLLIDDGVPSERIDVFALGGVEDDGPLDRVDVYVKS